MKLGLFAKRTVWLPTWRCWLLVLFTLSLGAYLFLSHLHDFLAVNQPVNAEVLIVEGWLSDINLERATEEFLSGSYKYVCTAGVPLEQGSVLFKYNTYAELAATIMKRYGMPEEPLIIAATPAVQRNRTFECARAAQKTLETKNIAYRAINVMSEGPHARRTRLVYRKVFGPDIQVGIIAAPTPNYDGETWWQSNEGCKEALTEFIGWMFEWIADSGRSDTKEAARANSHSVVHSFR